MTKIIDFKVRPFSKTKGRSEFCEHNIISVDADNRTIGCDECKRTLDPIDYLTSIAHRENSMWERYTKYDQEIYKLRKRYENLLKEIERLKKVRDKIKST